MTVLVATVSANIFESLAFANDLKYFVNPFRDFQIIFHPYSFTGHEQLHNPLI